MRGLRYVGFADIRPYRLDWAWGIDQNTAKVINVRNSFAPVALFDKEYDRLGLDPVAYGRYPAITAGEWVERKLVLYNDAFAGTEIRIEVTVNVDGKTYASGSRQVSLELGEHIELPCSFQVPSGASGRLDLVLRTFKGDEIKFEEARRFILVKGKGRAVTSREVRFGR